MKVLLHYDAGEKLRQKLATLADHGLAVRCCPESADHPFLDELADADVLWHALKPVSREVIEQAPRLKLIQKIGVGVNTIDLDAAQERNIAVCNMPGSNSQAVAEMALMLMLAALRRQRVLDHLVRGGQWYPQKSDEEQFGEIGGRIVGLVGFGSIPQTMAPVLEALGARVIYHARSPHSTASCTYSSLNGLLRQADIVSLHLPLTDQTHHLIGRNNLARMKPGAILINTARGGLVDEAALFDSLRSGHLAAAGLDVFYREPAEPANPLLALDQVVVTPHTAWLTRETWDRSLHVAVQNCLHLRDGRPLLHRVV